jgi:hypothetical protein
LSEVICMHRVFLLLSAVLALASIDAQAAQRKLTIKTFDGRVISGLVVLETERSLLLRTEQGNVNVTWAEIESTSDEPGATTIAQPASAPAAAANHSKTRLGVSLGIGVGPSGRTDVGQPTWLAGDVSAFVDLDLGRLGIRVGLDLQPGLRGFSSYSRPSAQLFGGIDSQLRLHFTERFGIGMGLVLGVGGSYENFGSFGAWFALGPTLTAAALRLGPGLNHELSLAGSLLFAAGPSNFAFAGGLVVVKYAYLF